MIFLLLVYGDIYDSPNRLLHEAILILGRKLFNFCMMPSKIDGEMYNFHNSLDPTWKLYEKRCGKNLISLIPIQTRVVYGALFLVVFSQ